MPKEKIKPRLLHDDELDDFFHQHPKRSAEEDKKGWRYQRYVDRKFSSGHKIGFRAELQK